MEVLALLLLIVVAGLSYGVYSTRNSFRRVLTGELQNWLAEGLITAEQTKRLRDKYKLGDLAGESQQTLINTIFIFGAVLVAGGIIAFVAAHWEGIPSFWKLVIIIGIMIAVQLTGFYFWKVKANLPQLGHALVLSGVLIFGANIALVAQIFHLTANYYEGFLIWTICALLIAYVTGSLPLAGLSLIASFIWFGGWKSDNPEQFTIYPWLVLLFYLPFAYRQHWRGLHFLTLLGWGAGLLIAAITQDNYGALLILFNSTLAALIFWSYADWPITSRNEDFHYDGKFLGILGLGVLCYFLSFHGLIEDVIDFSWKWEYNWSMAVTTLLAVLMVFSIGYGYRQSNRQDKNVGYIVLLITAVLCWLIIWSGSYFGVIGSTILGNLAVVLLGGFLFQSGLNQLDRRYFWMGLGLLVLEVVSRFFEYETGLLWKSLAFILAGLALIGGGLWFEKKYRKQVSVNENE